MDPILLAAIRHMVEAQRNATKAGAALQPSDLDAFIREETKGKYGLPAAQKVLAGIDTNVSVRNVGRSLLQGAAMDWGDELLGALPEALGGGAGAKEDMRLRESLFAQDHPVVDATAGVAGAIGSGLLMPAAGVKGAATVGRAVLRGAGVGAAAGALTGAGSGEGISDRVHRAGTGAVLGGVTGGLVPLPIAAAKSMTGVQRGARRIAHSIEKSGGIDIVAAANRAAKAAGRGDEVMLADLTPNLRQTARFAANNNPDVYSDAAEKINARQRGMSGRLLNDVYDLAGDRNAETRQATLESSRNAWAASDKGYNGLRAQPTTAFNVSKFAATLDKPVINEAWHAARLAGDIAEESPADKLFQKLLAQNPGKSTDDIQKAVGILTDGQQAGGARAVSFDDMQQFKRLLDGKVGEAYAKGNVPLGNALKAARDNVRESLVSVMPQYAVVDAEYAARKRLEDWLAKGVEEWGAEDTRTLDSMVKNLSPELLEEFRTGMASKMITTLRKAETNRDVAAKLVNRSPAMEDKLKVIFGDDKTFEKFLTRAQWEANMGKTRGAVGGSQTHLLDVDAEFDPIDVVPRIGEPLSTGLIRAGFDRTIGALNKNALQKGAQYAGDRLFTQGSSAIEDLLAKLQHPEPLVGSLGGYGLPAGAGSLFDRQ